MIPLPDLPDVSPYWQNRLDRLIQSTSSAPPPDLADIVREELGVNLTARFAGRSIPHPFGKASGQLSCTLRQVTDDCDSGLAFIVLKTVVAEGVDGERSMQEWVSDESKMVLERRQSRQGREGWTVTWRGRGWPGTLEEYMEFFRGSLDARGGREVPVVPSVQFHLPFAGEELRVDEYAHTTRCLLDSWNRACGDAPMLLETNMSPTLAAHERARVRDSVLQWLVVLPDLIDAVAPGRVQLGVKLMNSLFEDEYQIEMVRVLASRSLHPPAYLVVFNRLFDTELGVAYGGWDLSDRNLRVLDGVLSERLCCPPLSATGNICSGKMMLEYALRGCENGQLHTFFQLPKDQYTASGGSRSARALHTLVLHPTEGLVVWLRSAHESGKLDQRDGQVHFLDLVEQARGMAT